MELISYLQSTNIEKNIGEISFIRVSYYDHKLDQEKSAQEMLEKFLGLIFSLKKREVENFSILKNKQGLLLTIKFTDQCLVNLSLSGLMKTITPIFKLEIVGRAGMFKYDTQSDNAYSGNYKQLPIFSMTHEYSNEETIKEIVTAVHEAHEIEVILR